MFLSIFKKMKHFKITHKDGKARRGVLETFHGKIQTPVFMPVLTLGAGKGGVSAKEVGDLGADIVLANTYHLSLRPGEKIVKKAGGISEFMGWGGPVLTDSGGFQVFSLANLRGISEEGVIFKSHIDGAKLEFTPKRVMQIQNDLGSSIAMCFDECTQMDSEKSELENAVRKTTKWAKECKKYHKNSDQLLFGICQGGLDPEMCEKSAREIDEIGFDGIALGGLANGLPISKETREMTNQAIELRMPFLKEEMPKYLMGLGTPEDILDAVLRGVDMFDCVLPARMGRHGILWTSGGQIKIKNAKWAEDFSPVDFECDCPMCSNEPKMTKAFVRHLFSVKEDLARRLCVLHNFRFYLRLMKNVREVIQEGRFEEFRKECFEKWGGKV